MGTSGHKTSVFFEIPKSIEKTIRKSNILTYFGYGEYKYSYIPKNLPILQTEFDSTNILSVKLSSFLQFHFNRSLRTDMHHISGSLSQRFVDILRKSFRILFRQECSDNSCETAAMHTAYSMTDLIQIQFC